MAKINTANSTIADFRELFALVKPFHKGIFTGVAIGPLIGLLSMVPPYITKLLFDEVAISYDFTLLTLLVVGLVAFSLTSALSEAVLHYYSSYLNIKLENSTILHFMNHVQHLPLSFFYQRQMGEVASRFDEVKTALGSIHAFISVVFGKGSFLFIVPPFLFFLNWKLALVAIVAVPLSAILIYVLSAKLRSSWKNVVEAHADIDALKIEMLNQISTVKTMQLEPIFHQKAADKLTKLLGDHLRAQTLSVFFMIFDKCISIVNVGLFAWLGWYFIIKGEMSVGDYVAFTAYVAYLRNPMKELVNLFNQFQQWAVNLNRIFEYLHHPTEQAFSCSNGDLKNNLSGPVSVEFRNICFSYRQSRLILDDVNIRANAGEVIALIGTSGSGKSTLLKLLCRLENQFSGDIDLNNSSINNLSIYESRAAMSIVWQEVELFRGTLWENLTIGAPVAKTQWVKDIVELCRLTDVIADLPDGYQTNITDQALTLSGGQKQRIALARALICDSPVLLLDEATSNLDVEHEDQIIKAVLKHAKERNQTILLVTHRLALTKLVDRIYFMHQGRVLSSGSHEQLYGSSEHYQRWIGLNQGMDTED